MKRAVGFLAALVLTVGLVRPCWGVELTLTSHAALLMEKSTGEILYAQRGAIYAKTIKAAGAADR